nr:AAA family ATPase [SAR324 cluster bacterium]
MIEKITVEKIASFDNTKRIEKKEDYGVISDLKKINFFYGANASGKTTISRIIDRESEEITTSLIADDSDKSDDYSIDWKSKKKLKTFVYNSDFIKENFVPGKDL